MANKLEVLLSVTEQGMDSFRKIAESIVKLKAEVGDSSGKGGLSGAFNGLAKKVMIAGAAAGGVFIAYEAMKRSFNTLYGPASQIAEVIERQSLTLGMSTSSLQQWNFVATQNKASAESVTKGFTELTKKSFEAYTGNKAASEAFKAAGVNILDGSGYLKNSNTIVNDTVAALSEIKNPAERAALAYDLFGRSSKELLPMLAQGKEELDKQRESATKLGQVLGESAISNLTKTGDAFERLKTASAV